MTHTLNRTGLSEAKPGEEIIVLCMVHRPDKIQKMQQMQEIATTILRYEPDNIIGRPLGLGADEIVSLAPIAGIITAVFSDKETALKVVQDIKSQKPGVSVVLSGLFTDVHDVCSCAGLKEHTYHISLGILGKTDRLPAERTMEIVTQCGHSLISPHLVSAVVKNIRKGKMTCEEGAHLLVKPCACGIGNPKRIQKILEELV
jgi:hypothetical protein